MLNKKILKLKTSTFGGQEEVVMNTHFKSLYNKKA